MEGSQGEAMQIRPCCSYQFAMGGYCYTTGSAASFNNKVQSHAICSLNLPFLSRNTYRTSTCGSFYTSQCIFPLNKSLFEAVLQRRLQSFLSAPARQSILKYEA
jgi:hypothetical protein